MTRQAQMQRYGTFLIWLALVPVATYHTETGPGGCSILFRSTSVIARPRAALAVELALTEPHARQAF